MELVCQEVLEITR